MKRLWSTAATVASHESEKGASGRVWSLVEMEDIGLAKVFEAFRMLSGFAQTAQNLKVMCKKWPVLVSEDYERLQGHAIVVRDFGIRLDMPLVAMSSNRLLSQLEEFGTGADTGKISLEYQQCEILSLCLTEVVSRLDDSISLKRFFLLADGDVSVFEEAYLPFGSRVASELPSCVKDAVEAARCLALKRYTASVFHSLRCLEAAKFGRLLDV